MYLSIQKNDYHFHLLTQTNQCLDLLQLKRIRLLSDSEYLINLESKPSYKFCKQMVYTISPWIIRVQDKLFLQNKIVIYHLLYYSSLSWRGKIGKCFIWSLRSGKLLSNLLSSIDRISIGGAWFIIPLNLET